MPVLSIFFCKIVLKHENKQKYARLASLKNQIDQSTDTKFCLLCITRNYIPFSVASKRSPNVYKSFQKIISLEKLNILTPSQKLPKNVGNLGKLTVHNGFEKLPKVQ